MSFFSLDSKFSQIMGRVFDLMMLNIIFLIMCIPIVTIGANFTAMYYVTLKMIKNEETYIFRTYWKSFRENFKQATAIWLILLAVLIVLILDLLLVMRMPKPTKPFANNRRRNTSCTNISRIPKPIFPKCWGR